ncbi:MAG: flavodoxin domain-containing protein, partial [Ectothiorhodospiraceae bacterium]|nr:flavodoxin domain-containing protein [Ectothiorhodospiraceae bacterium]
GGFRAPPPPNTAGPPAAARRIEELLDNSALPAGDRSGLRYAVLGCGNSQWRTYQAFPKRIEAALADSGARALLPRGEADGNGDFDGAVERWLATFWNALGEQVDAGPGSEPPLGVTLLTGKEARARILPADAQTMTVLRNEELVHDATGLWDFAQESPRGPTRHLVLQLPPGTRYRTGDHLMVYPSNPPERVEAAAGLLGLTSSDVVVLEGNGGRSQHLPLERPVSLAQLFSNFIELQEPITRRQLRRLTAFTPCPHTRGELERLTADTEDASQQYQREIADRRLCLLDLLQQHPAIQLSLQDFLGFCPPLRPRFYSISSSPMTAADTVSLTIGTVDGPAWSGRGRFRGVASTFLAGVQPGDEVIGYVSTPSPAFAPQQDAGKPMILIGPGTGIAPFRGFLEERLAQQQSGLEVAPSLLFFGCRHPEHDWLYRQEMQTWQARGAAKLHLAFSCLEGHPYRYVQDALWAERNAVWEAVQQGATIYVCGDGSHMAPAVRDCLIRIHRDQAGSTLEQASEWLEALMAAGGYRQDVFGPA